MFDFSRITNVKRDRDVYKLYLDNTEKYYGIDLANGCIIGLRGVPIKTDPFKDSNTYNYFYYRLLQSVRLHQVTYHFREYVDRIITSTDFDFKKKKEILNIICRQNYSNIEIFEKYWKTLLNYWKEKDACNYALDVKSIIGKIEVNAVCEKYNLPFDMLYNSLQRYYNPIQIIDHLNIKPIRSTIKKYLKIMENMEEVFSTMFNSVGVVDSDVLFERYGIEISTVDEAKSRVKNRIPNIFDSYDTALKHIEKLGLENYEFSDDVTNDCNQLYIQVQIRENAEKEKIFAKYQLDHLFFENEKFKIYIPHTYKELMDIGKYFHNCAAEHEWYHYLHADDDAQRRLVIVVDKNKNKWEVCVDIDNDYDIRQYLCRFNESCDDEELLSFQKAYQIYLKAIENKFIP